MTDKRKAPGSAATLTGARRETAAGMAHDSYINHTTTLARRQHEIVTDMIPCGRENAIKLPQVAQLLDTDSRTARLMIQRARRSAPILSDNYSGYWISHDETEIRQFCRSMKHRARQVWATARAVEVAAGLGKLDTKIDGQETFFNGGDT